jgi:tRNA (guanine9-N1)-methyltransferase
LQGPSCIDCLSFISQEIKSLCSQLAYTYSANRNAAYPFSLTFTSLNGRTYERLESLGDASYKRWPSAQWTSESYEKLWGTDEFAEPSEATTTARGPLLTGNDSTSQNDSDAMALSVVPENTGTDLVSQPVTDAASEAVASSSTQPNAPPKLAKSSVVYLTADTEDELTELRPDETYIIGGIVDHNRYKVSAREVHDVPANLINLVPIGHRIFVSIKQKNPAYELPAFPLAVISPTCRRARF